MSAALRDESQDAIGLVRRKPRPAPIAYPSRAHVDELCRTRANNDNKRWEAQVQRRDMLIAAAWQEGHDQGERAGYTAGWHWGCVCGIAAGGGAVGLLWAAWAPLQRALAAWGLA